MPGRVDPATMMMLALWRRGESFATIATRYGLSRQRVRQKVSRVASAADRRANNAARERARRARRREVERAEALERGDAPTCVLPWCDRLVRRGRTCSPEHSHEWEVVRFHIDPAAHQRHRVAMARVKLANPDATDADRAWARRMLSDDPPPPNRRFRRPGSEADLILKAHGL
jgi:hypothetical protein